MVRLNRTHYSLLQAKVLNLSFKIWYGLTVHIICFYRQNFQFFKIVPSRSNSSELRKFRTICPHSPRIRQNSHILLTFSIMFQVPAPAENPGKFQQITQNSARFAHIARKSREFRTLRTIINPCLVHFQISDHRQRTQEKWSESTRFRAIRPQLPRMTRNSLNPHHNEQTRSPSRELQETYSECRKLCTFRTMHGQITQNSQHLP